MKGPIFRRRPKARKRQRVDEYRAWARRLGRSGILMSGEKGRRTGPVRDGPRGRARKDRRLLRDRRARRLPVRGDRLVLSTSPPRLDHDPSDRSGLNGARAAGLVTTSPRRARSTASRTAYIIRRFCAPETDGDSMTASRRTLWRTGLPLAVF